MRVLLLGSGGRESALGWALARSRHVSELIVTPGNPGLAAVADVVSADISDPASVLGLVRQRGIRMVVVGPEAPLVAGVADAVRASGVAVFGPDAAAARIEGSKSYAKRLMLEAGIPTADGRAFSEVGPAVAHLDRLGPPYVVKADGLAAGKGVVVTENRREAIEAIEERIVHRRFGASGENVVIEEFLGGEELSLIAFTDGRAALACEPAQDFKRVGEGDSGPNTGGMGSYSPVPSCPGDLIERIVGEVIEPMVAATTRAGAPFVGALYAGLALTERGPRVIEFNARFGDPETQALVPRLESDLGELCFASATGELEGAKLEWSPRACVSVVLASRGYPGEHDTGLEISGMETAASQEDVVVFHAGTAVDDGRLVTAGGRVLSVSALGDGFRRARARAYEAVRLISFEGMQYRNDIALRAERYEGSV